MPARADGAVGAAAAAAAAVVLVALVALVVGGGDGLRSAASEVKSKTDDSSVAVSTTKSHRSLGYSLQLFLQPYFVITTMSRFHTEL